MTTVAPTSSRTQVEPEPIELNELEELVADETAVADDSVLAGLVRLVAPAARLIVWVYVYLIALLGGWVLLATVFAGWDPVVVTSGSMEPSIRVGDVLLVSDPPSGLVAQHGVITFERDDGEFVAHRVAEVFKDTGEYRTKGDANDVADLDFVPAGNVTGVGRLVVPVVGVPVLWASEGNLAPLIAWVLLTLAAAGYVIRTAASEIRKRRNEDDRQHPGGVATAGIRRVRALVVLMICIQYFIDPARFDVVRRGAGREGVLIVSVGVLVCLNLVSARIGRRDPDSSRRMAVFELAVDTALVVFIATATGTDGIGWVLFALPVIEAAVRFGLTGGLVHWMALTAITIGARIGFAETSAGNSLLLGDLEEVLDQLSVLFIVVIPGAYLAEQLISDVQRHQRATNAAVGRGELLEQVVASGHEVNRLGDHHLDALSDGVMSLGYDTTDIVLSVDGGSWRVLASRGDTLTMPPAGDPGSGLRPYDLRHVAVVVDRHEDPDDADKNALEAAGIARLVAITVSDGARGRVVLRAAKAPQDSIVDTARIDALRLLAGQAAVALQNDQLLHELTSVHDELEHQATHDALTGLPNRPRMLREVTAAVAAGRTAALLFLDLDGFKPVNDRLGHDAGDELLRIVADRLTEVTGQHGLVARLGGDEFTILFTGPEASAHGARVAADIHTALARTIRLDMESVHIAASIGLADSEDGLEGMELVRRADVAMYNAKRIVQDGRPFVRYRTELDATEARRADLARDLLPSLENGAIRLEYQPIVYVNRGDRVVGVEALVRWTHPIHGPVGPEELVQLAEDVGHCDELQRFIVRRAAHDAATLVRDHPDDGIFVTVNASPAELRSPSTVANVQQALADSGLPARSLFVEISERLVDPDEEAVAATMQSLRANGVNLLLDDFGEGQTSLSFLHQLPITGIKLDRKLVLNSVRSETERVVVESIVELANRLGMTVIAEGIETQDHLDTIMRTGCNIVQGYHFHPPLELTKISTLLRHQSIGTQAWSPSGQQVTTATEVT